jgi:hypothetical protein
MTGTGDCSARVAEAHVTTALLNSVMNSRRLMPDLGVSPALLPARAFSRGHSIAGSAYGRGTPKSLGPA